MTFTRKHREPVQAGLSAARQEAPDFEALFQQHWTRLCWVLFRLVGDWPEAEDLALDAFDRLYRRPPGDSGSLGGWLYRVATNLGFNALRSRKRRQRYEEESGYTVLPGDPSWDPAEEIEKVQERERVRTVLAQMKPRSAQILVLRHSGLSYAEVAGAVGVAPSSVGALLARAEQEFEDRFRRLEGEGG